MSPRHARQLFVPLAEASDNLTRSAVLRLPAMSNDICNGRTEPDQSHVRDGRVAPSRSRLPCRAQLPLVRATVKVTRQ